jgi:hypothetical protein
MMLENKCIYFISRHSKLLTGVFLTGALALIGLEMFFSKQAQEAKKDYLVIRQIYDQFSQSKFLPSESLAKAEKVLKKHPELHPSFDMMMFQSYLCSDSNSLAFKYISKPTKSKALQTPDIYATYNSISGLILQQDFENAYERAQLLQTQLQQNTSTTIVSALNLLRLYFLAEKLADHEMQKQWLAQLKADPSYAQISSLFRKGSISLDSLSA